MKVSIHANSAAPIGVLIERLLEQAEEVFIASAYISAKAVDTLSARTKRRAPGTLSVDVLFGLDAETDFTAVQRIYEAGLEEPERLRVRYTAHRAGRLFHPKVYFFRQRSICHILIASANLTEAGQRTNEEMYCHLECASTHETVAQFNAVRQMWLAEPFSAVLDERVLGARAGIEDQKQRLREAEEAFAGVISGVGKRIVIVPPEDILAPLRAALANGYLIAPTFSLSNLYVSVQDILKPTDGSKPVKENQVVIVQNRSSALIKLLPDESLREFSSLQRTAREVCESLSISISAGLYIPETAHKALAKNIGNLERKHSALINSLVKNRTAINKHLKDKLEDECRDAWQALHPEEDLAFPDELLPEIRKRVEERRKRLEQNPHDALRFDFQAYPHPLVLMNELPNSLAWTLQKGDPDQETIRTIITLLRGQIELLKGVTQWSKQSIIKRDFERVRLLISIRGKATDALLRTVSSWVRESQTKLHGQTPDQKRSQLARKVEVVKRKADEHIAWLIEVEKLDPKVAVTKLLNEYHSLQSK